MTTSGRLWTTSATHEQALVVEIEHWRYGNLTAYETLRGYAFWGLFPSKRSSKRSLCRGKVSSSTNRLSPVKKAGSCAEVKGSGRVGCQMMSEMGILRQSGYW